MWSGSGRNLIILTGLGGLAAYMWAIADVGPAGLVIGTAALLVAVFFCWVRVQLTETSIEIELGPLRWPKKVIPLDEVTEATVEKIQPLRYGGWGYRVCGRGCRAIVVRRGEALKLKMHDEKVFMVTVDGAQEAADLIKGYLERRGST